MEQLSRAFWRTFWKGPRSGAPSGALLGEGPLSGALLVAFCSLLSPGPGEKSHFWLISRIKPPLVDTILGTISIYIGSLPFLPYATISHNVAAGKTNAL